MSYRYFTPDEVRGLNSSLIELLDKARVVAGIPFKIGSGLRSVESNRSIIGAVPESSHLKGLAVDLMVSSGREVALILHACKSVGIDRFGIYSRYGFPSHVHVDVDPDKISNVIWTKEAV